MGNVGLNKFRGLTFSASVETSKFQTWKRRKVGIVFHSAKLVSLECFVELWSKVIWIRKLMSFGKMPSIV